MAATQEILSHLAENAMRDLPSAQSLHPAIYHDPDIFALETERIFLRDWICVGRLIEMPNAGDYIAVEIVDQPVVVVRQRDKSVRAFSNVCLHRSARMLDDSGHVARITCPYHSWTYDLNGQLIGAPFMQETADFNVADFCLREHQTMQWQGFVYVSLDPETPPIVDGLTELDDLVGKFEMADYVPVYTETEHWKCNWKCLVENYMDVYHLHRVHAESFGKYGSHEDMTYFFPGTDVCCYHYVQEREESTSIWPHPNNTRLNEDERFRTYLINIFPAHTIQLQPDMLWYLSILPSGPEHLDVRWSVSVPPDYFGDPDGGEQHIKENVDLILQVNSEDKQAVERVQRGTAEAGATTGPLSRLERSVWDFGRYLARRLCD